MVRGLVVVVAGLCGVLCRASAPDPAPPLELCEHSGAEEAAAPGSLNLTVQHPLFDTSAGLLPGLVYSVSVLGAGTSTRLSLMGPPGRGVFLAGPAHLGCPGRPWAAVSAPRGSPVSLNWTLSAGQAAGNLTFRLLYGDSVHPGAIYLQQLQLSVLEDCELRLRPARGNVSWRDLPADRRDCRLLFPAPEGDPRGVLVDLTRLSVPCRRGYLQLGDPARRLCGKLEELPAARRRLYFPAAPPRALQLQLRGGPVFALAYRLVDHCYNVTLTARQDSVQLRARAGLECTFRVHVPYGNRAVLHVQVDPGGADCAGLRARLWDGATTSSLCSAGDLRAVSRANQAWLQVSGGQGELVRLSYSAQPEPRLVQTCPYGWVAARQHCLAAVEDSRLPWAEAEDECRRRDGHLAAVRGQDVQSVLDALLLNSPAHGEHAAYWVGASDQDHEGDFRWTSGLPFVYTNWFPGWPHEDWYNRQPNDDPYGDQDCLEVRQVFHTRASGARLAQGFHWNDRDCATANYFLCERLMPGVADEDSWQQECNRSVVLGRDQPRATIVSPQFPRAYPDNVDCDTDIAAPAGFQLVLEFEELVLEDEESCGYDYLELVEVGANQSEPAARYCGDWSSKLKLLRYVSSGPQLRLHFVSDYSHHSSGFKARVSMQTASAQYDAAVECGEERLQVFGQNCYLFVAYPGVTWHTAHHVCGGMKAELASVHSSEEQHFVTANIRSSTDYSTSSLYWLGGRLQRSLHGWRWADGSEMAFTAWLGEEPPGLAEEDLCLAMQWVSTGSAARPSGLYWQPRSCDALGGYVCKKSSQAPRSQLQLNRTLNGSEGHLSSPGYPESYPPDLDYWVRIQGAARTRVVLLLSSLDLEEQPECLYDYLELRAPGAGTVRWCGRHEDVDRLRLVSDSSELELHFHSDYSVSGAGFAAAWRAVDMSGCSSQTLTAAEGSLASPNYPHFLLPRLDCATTVLAPAGMRVWLEFADWDVEAGAAVLELDLGDGGHRLQPFQAPGLLTDGAYISHGQKLRLQLRTEEEPRGRGFKATFRTVSKGHLERLVNLSEESSGALRHLNFPAALPADTDLVQHLVVPPGSTVLLELYGVVPGEDGCPGAAGVLEVVDNYAGDNGTAWLLCKDRRRAAGAAPLAITSYLNTLHLRQRSWAAGLRLNASLRVQSDSSYKLKLLRRSEEGRVETCRPSPCLNGGKCISRGHKHSCQCIGHFTGMFCALTMCELEPCLFGRCQLTATSYSCSCQAGYAGKTCEEKQQPCADNPCEGRGECVLRGDSFYCRCHAWWEGPRCERRMLHIPFKPLSERMLQEPFWLGLITVTVVLAVIGLVWCAKRHFPEKLEKLLAEEADRHRPSVSCHSRPPSVRDQLGGAGTTVVVVPSPPHGRPRSLLGRLGIRKPSLLSLTSPHGPAATARTFSLDDLLKPPPRRTPSPRKKRNNSTPTKQHACERKQILQQLVASEPPARKLSLGELLQLSESRGRAPGPPEAGQRETAFADPPAADPRLEKKVTFARLLSKVSAEMSSGSDASQLLSRSNSSPPSPAAEQRSPHSTSSNQGSDSLSSLERPLRARAPSNHSADSILAMFRSFSSSSPRDDVAGSDDSSASSGPAPDSPPRRHTIEVAVLDGRGGHAQHPASILLEVPGAGAAKCLSPIREVPTPALTPVLARRGACSDDEDASPFPSGLESPATRCIPLLVVQEASPTRSPPLGSPPPRSSAADTSLVFGPRPTPRRLLKDLDKPASLDLPCPPPLITVTCNMSEAESDAEVASPVKKLAEHPGPASGMTYLSPFSMCSRADRAASESNLSSSGYSSMASPGPSRCGSNNPLCPSELEDGPAARSRPPPAPLRPPAAAPEVATPGPLQEPCDAAPDCGDSETQSDDPLAESNDEGIGTDHLDEKIDEGELKSAKELQVFIGKEAESSPCRSMLQLPSIVVQEAGGGADKHLSPVSSRSESPLSDKLAGPGRFSPLFYGRHKDQLPFTDSDGLYDCPSSDCPKALQQHRKSTGRRREKRAASRGKAGSPTKVTALLDVPGRQLPRKHSPKRARVRLQTRVSSSSSSESLASARESVASHAVPCPDSQLPAEWGLSAKPRLLEMSAEENSEDAHSGGLHEVLCRGELPKPVRSTGRLRAIGHQIRFLRRLQQGLRQREALASPSDSVDSCADEEDDDEEGSSPVLSPLLPQVTKSQSRLRGPTRHRVPQGWQVLPQEDHYV